MEPLTAILVASAASAAIEGISGYFSGKDAAAAQENATATAKAEAARIQALVDKIQDPKFNGVLTKAEIEDLVRFDPTFPKKIAELPPETLPQIAASAPDLLDKVVEANPAVAKFIAEKMPELIKAEGLGAKEGRDAQRAALQALRKAGTEDDIISQSEMMRARESAAQAEAGQRGALTEEMARRGQLGGGQELLMKLSNQQASQQNAAMSSTMAAEDAIRRRLEALRGAGSLGGQMFEQDVGIEKSNLDAINSFNMRNTQAQRDIERSRVADMNARATREAAAARDRGKYNVGVGNEFKAMETDYERSRAQRDWEANEDYKRLETAYERSQAADRANIVNAADAEQRAGIRDLTLSERARQDDLSQQRFQNDLSKVGMQQGIANTNVGIAQGEAAAKSAAARNTGQFWGDIAKTGVETMGTYYGMKQSEEDSAIDRELRKEKLKQLRNGG